MDFDRGIFKAYDVRGIYPQTINEEIAQKIGLAFADLFQLKRVAIGRDGRLSSPFLKRALAQGIIRKGSDVFDLGIVSTDMVYFAAGYYPDLDGAVMVTASHNPRDHNGFKFILKGAVAVSGETGLSRMCQLIQEDHLSPAAKLGKIRSRQIYADYIKKLHSLINPNNFRPLKVVVDAGNGVGGFVFKKVIKGLPIKMIPLYCEIDGRFPHHQPSPIEEKNIVDLRRKVVQEKADLGLAFDGDGDRVFLIDEQGKPVSATITGAMLIKKILKQNPQSRILYNLICGWIVPETIKAYGGKPSITKVGHSIIKAQMRKEKAIFACEHSGHYYFKDLYYADSAMLASLIILELISQENKPLSQIVAPFDKYYLSGEINLEVFDQKAKIEELKEKYKDGVQLELDGLSVEYPFWRFNVRPSNTEPLLRLNVEASDRKLLQEKTREILKLIKGK